MGCKFEEWTVDWKGRCSGFKWEQAGFVGMEYRLTLLRSLTDTQQIKANSTESMEFFYSVLSLRPGWVN